MNRNQRRLGRQHQKRFEEFKHPQFEEVLPPRIRRDPSKLQKFTTNKCCYVVPAKEDFGQSTDANECVTSAPADKYQNALKEQFGFDPLMPETINQLKELRKVLCNGTAKVENSSQYADEKSPDPEFPALPADGSLWQTIDNVAEIDKYLGQEKDKGSSLFLPENVRIAETPRIKLIAKKFSKLRRNNIELRKLDEKVVCVEYDVFIGNDVRPREKLRAFFSIKPSYDKNGSEKGHSLPAVPSVLKEKFNINDEDLKKFNEKEIEIIDGKIEENKSYLDDLKRILRRKQAITMKKNKSTLDLKSLYEMAKRACPPLDDGFSNTNFLSRAELQEMKDLIIKKCASSVHGINKRTLKKENGAKASHMGVISQSIVAELWREGENTLSN